MSNLGVIDVQGIRICNAAGTPIWIISLSPNTQGDRHRLTIETIGDEPAEVMFDSVGFKKKGIVFQLMGMGPVLPNGRQRWAVSINREPDGVCTINQDSSVTSGSTCDPMSFVFGFNDKMYAGIYPDKKIYLADDTEGARLDVRRLFRSLIKLLRGVPDA